MVLLCPPSQMESDQGMLRPQARMNLTGKNSMSIYTVYSIVSN